MIFLTFTPKSVVLLHYHPLPDRLLEVPLGSYKFRGLLPERKFRALSGIQLAAPRNIGSASSDNNGFS